jgi:hypothetical protein
VREEPSDLLIEAVRGAGPRPEDDARREAKKNYAERLSNRVALAIAARLRALGLAGCQPDAVGGRERQFAGGIGAKRSMSVMRPRRMASSSECQSKASALPIAARGTTRRT